MDQYLNRKIQNRIDTGAVGLIKSDGLVILFEIN